jgi:hypothetical protein
MRLHGIEIEAERYACERSVKNSRALRLGGNGFTVS